MNVKTLATLGLLAVSLSPLASSAQVLTETMAERAERCKKMAELLPPLEEKAAEYASRLPAAVAAEKARPVGNDPEGTAARFAGEGARMLRLVEPIANACGVAAPEVGARADAIVESIYATRSGIMTAIIEKGEAELRAKGLVK